MFELIGFQWTRRFLLIERFDCLRGRMFERRGRRAEAVLVRGKKERRKRLGMCRRLQRARRTAAGKFSHKQKAHGFCPRLFDGSVSNAQFLPRLSRMKGLGAPDLRCGVPFHGIGTAVSPQQDEMKWPRALVLDRQRPDHGRAAAEATYSHKGPLRIDAVTWRLPQHRSCRRPRTRTHPLRHRPHQHRSRRRHRTRTHPRHRPRRRHLRP